MTQLENKLNIAAFSHSHEEKQGYRKPWFEFDQVRLGSAKSLTPSKLGDLHNNYPYPVLKQQ